MIRSFPAFGVCFILCLLHGGGTFARVDAAGAPRSQLPDQFYATTGTTIPFTTMEPVSQSGAMYVDAPKRKMRVDTFWQGDSRSIVVDGDAGRCFVLESRNGGACRVLPMTFSHDTPFFHAIPDTFISDSEKVRVRGVPVTRYSGVEQGEYLQEVSFYVRNTSIPVNVVNDSHLDGSTDTLFHDVMELWRIETRRSHRREITPPPYPDDAMPNWRFFGQPLNELVALDEVHTTALEGIDMDVPVTVDFFNFVARAPDASVFQMPSHCQQTDDTKSATTMQHDAKAFSPQRMLVDLSFHGVALSAIHRFQQQQDGRCSSKESPQIHEDL
mmetsp:Transcript_26920/g.31088  ORF Transcript_26920/g.31088 Transcript_26920/m.31088 type:complete len:328 (-) Transcript_26920:148-1131(-)